MGGTGSEEDGRSRIVCSTRLVRPFKHTTPVISRRRKKERKKRKGKKKNFLLERGKILVISPCVSRHLFFFLFFFYSIHDPPAFERDKSAQSRGREQSTDFSLPPSSKKTRYYHHLRPPPSTNFFVLHGFNPRLFLARSNLSRGITRSPFDTVPDISPTRREGQFFPPPSGRKSEEKGKMEERNFFDSSRTYKAITLCTYWVSIRTCRALITYTRRGVGVMDFH